MNELIHIGKGLSQEGWTKLLQAWFDVMTRFILETPKSKSTDDLPYWYNERSNAGNLAAAAWGLNGIALQEFTVERGNSGRPELVSKTKSGWCDLWVQIPSLGDFEYDIEAKFAWVKGLSEAQKACERLVDDAVIQIGDYAPRKKRPCDSMALCFLSAYHKSRSEAEVLLDDLEVWFKSEYTRPDNLLAIYKAPIGAKMDDVYSKDGVRYFYPGVALYGQLVRFTKPPETVPRL